MFSASTRRLLWRGTGVVWVVFTVLFAPIGIYIFPIAIVVLVLAVAICILGPRNRLAYGSAAIAATVGVLMLAFVPSSKGSEYALAAEAVLAFATATYTLAATRLGVVVS